MISLIVATDEKSGIGFQNKLPWPRIPEDMKRFRDLTMGHNLIMGRKTYESLEKPYLDGRHIIVLTHNKEFKRKFISVVHTIEDALNFEGDIFICGGAEIYDLFLPYVDMIYITTVHGEFECDVKWNFDLKDWDLIDMKVGDQCTFKTYSRILNNQRSRLT